MLWNLCMGHTYELNKEKNADESDKMIINMNLGRSK